MSEPLRIQVDRPRAVCPYCKGDVAGHVWLCPGCEAPHHADCAKEHGRCATCEHVIEGEGRQDDRLRKVRAALADLGFSILREGPDEVVGFHMAWALGTFEHVPLAVHVLRVPALTLERVQADLRRLDADPLAKATSLVLYIADSIAWDAAFDIEKAKATRGRTRAAVAWSPEKGLVRSQVVFGGSALTEGHTALQVIAKAFPAQVRPRPAPPPSPAPRPPAPVPPATATPVKPADAPANPAHVALAVAGALFVSLLLLALAIAAAG